MSIETTAYGLLHLLLWEGKAGLADQAASWLTGQGSFQGGFRSTQVGAVLGFLGWLVLRPESLVSAHFPRDTVMALDALSASAGSCPTPLRRWGST